MAMEAGERNLAAAMRFSRLIMEVILSCLSTKVALAMAIVCSPAFADEALYHQSVNRANPDGKDLIMRFDEVARDDKTSTIKIVLTSGASVPSALFIAKGVYNIARQRGKAYYIKLREWHAKDHGTMMQVGFSDDATVDPTTYFALHEPLPPGKGYAFEPVARFDLLFERDSVNMPQQ